MNKHWSIAVRLTFLTVIIFGVVYPILITGIAKIIGPGGGAGEKISANGRVIGFELIGQKFGDDRYFNSRPSAVDYNAASTGGSNKGPTNPEYLATVRGMIDSFLADNPAVKKEDIPVDLVTASGSGIDPHISPEAAKVQIDRIARMRNISREKLEALVNDHIEAPVVGFLGTERVHILRLNLALDQL